jgi:hypothetical protein
MTSPPEPPPQEPERPPEGQPTWSGSYQGYPSYAGQPPAPPPSPPTSTKATLSLVLGLVGLLCCGLLAGIPAILLGFAARKEVKDSGGAVTGDGLALGGIITGAIAVLWSLLAVVAVVAVLAFGDAVRDEIDRNCVRVTNPDGTTRIECDLDGDRRFDDDGF